MESRTESVSDTTESFDIFNKILPPVSYIKNTNVAYEILQFICSGLSEIKILEAIKPFIEKNQITGEQLSEKMTFLTSDTCLHKAVEKDLLTVTQFLLEKGANPAIKNADGKIPQDLINSQLMKNLFHNFYELNNINVSIDPLYKEKSLLHELVISNDSNKLTSIEEYIKKKLPLNEQDEAGKTPLHYVAESGDIAVLTLLCDQPELQNLLDNNGEDVFFKCVRNKFLECLKILLAMRPEFLINYLRNKNELSIKELVFSINNHDMRKEMIHLLFPHFAAKMNNCADIIQYIGEGLPINIQNKSKKTILHIATENGNASLVLALIKQPLLDPNMQDFAGKTPLYNAVSLYLEEVKLGPDQLQVLTPKEVIEAIKKIEDERLFCVKTLTTSQHSIKKNIVTNEGNTIENLLENAKNEEKKQLVIKAIFSRYNIKPQSNNLCFFSTKTINHYTPEFIIDKYKYLPFKKIMKNKLEIIPTIKTIEYNKKIGKIEEELEGLLLDHGLKGRYFKSGIKVRTFEEFKRIVDRFFLGYENSTKKFLSKNTVPGSKRKAKKSFVELFVLMNEICLGTVVGDFFNLEYQDIYKKTVGLLSFYEPHDIIRSIIILTPFFCENQILAGSLVVKNILLLSVEFGFNRSNKIFMETLTYYLDKFSVPGVKNIMMDMLQVVNEYYPFIDESGYKSQIKGVSEKINFMSQVDTIIHGVLTNKKYKERDVDFLVNEINNLTLRCYKCCPLNIFFEKNKNTAIFDMFFSIFDRFADYVSWVILSQKTIEDVNKIYKLFILVAKKLVLYADMNAVTLLMSALQRPAVNRVIKMDIETSHLYDNLKMLTSENGTYAHLEEIKNTYPESLRYIALICKDDIYNREKFSPFFNPKNRENQPDNFVKILHNSEKLYFPLIELKKKLENVACDFQSNILYKLNHFSLDLDNIEGKFTVLEKLSYQLKPDALNLDKNTFNSFLDNLIAFINARKPLYVMLNAKQYKDKKAIKIIKEWMISKTESEDLSETEIIRLNEITKGVLVECEEYIARLKTDRSGTPVGRRLLERRNTFHNEQESDLIELENRPLKTL